MTAGLVVIGKRVATWFCYLTSDTGSWMGQNCSVNYLYRMCWCSRLSFHMLWFMSRMGNSSLSKVLLSAAHINMRGAPAEK